MQQGRRPGRSSSSCALRVSNRAPARVQPSSSPASPGSFCSIRPAARLAVGGQQQPGGQLLGLAEIVLERRRPGRPPPAPPGPGSAAGRAAAGAGFSMVIASIGVRARGRAGRAAASPSSSTLGDAAQGAGGGAFGEQRAQRAVAAQLDRQPAVDLGVAGEQRRGGGGFAQQLGARCRAGSAARRGSAARCRPGARARRARRRRRAGSGSGGRRSCARSSVSGRLRRTACGVRVASDNARRPCK